MQSLRATRSAVVLFGLAPVAAWAHGEEVFLFPVGTLAAIGALLILSSLWALGWGARIAASAAAIAASVPFWVMPGDAFPEVMQHTEWGNFVLGFLPCVLAGGMLLMVFRWWKVWSNDA